MQVEEDDSRSEGQMASTSTIDKGKAILIKDSNSDDDSQVALIDTSTKKDNAPVLGPTDIYTTGRTSSIDYLRPYLCCFASHVYNVHIFIHVCSYYMQILFLLQQIF